MLDIELKRDISSYRDSASLSSTADFLSSVGSNFRMMSRCFLSQVIQGLTPSSPFYSLKSKVSLSNIPPINLYLFVFSPAYIHNLTIPKIHKQPARFIKIVIPSIYVFTGFGIFRLTE